jgi:hypothetical protein
VAGASPGVLDPEDVEISKTGEVRELNVSSLCSSNSGGPVILDDALMH